MRHKLGFGQEEPLCAQVGALYPEKETELYEKLGKWYSTEEFKQKAIEYLGGAVRVPTESYDKMEPVGVDPRWEAFGPFHEYLSTTYPLIHSTLTLTKVNTWGLVYVWKGSNESLKPLLLAAHQDVVPVEPTTVDTWEHPPYSGFFDGERIWGRGSSDDKSGLIGIMSTVETLITNGFKPTRTIFLAFGFDEETSGLHGANEIGKYLLSTYGENHFGMIVDEGGGFARDQGTVFATPGIAEKGYLDTRIHVASPGGHSSVPPPHTSIGMLAQMLVDIEANPPEPHIERDTPMYSYIQCLAEHGTSVPRALRKAIKTSVYSDKALKKVEDELLTTKQFRALVGTTQAEDLISGGVKTNALPEQAWAVVNHRIATQSSLAEAMKSDTDRIIPLAARFNLSLTAFGEVITPADTPAYGTVTLSDAWGNQLAPAPVTPTGADAVPYKVLSGTIKATFNSHRAAGFGLTDGQEIENETIVVSPGIMTGNTDTRYYWKLTPHIFRYNHRNSADEGKTFGGAHTTNESIHVDAFLEIIRYFTGLILNVDEAEGI
ncbi:carboxypeptidase S [Stereum hirsutum FP-91666 SS1]|uniref:carboxypeptidase S n=1 Tax=Stereum hirsutum (strain FP-91666) TaxID=721885 RepID=UPI000440B6FF|nr:carboxypeptidase S [Stereum hirsutum FP-91666 SS1]EIM86689.1 carboxypeptidase S [Stereum hirsutum FP-91666 SS1]